MRLFPALLLIITACQPDATSPTDTSPIDTATPTAALEDILFLNLRVEEIGANEAIVRFETSEPTTCATEYGLLSGALDLSATDPTMSEDDPFSITHEIPLFDLQADSTYFWQGVVVDPDGREFISTEQSFDTLVDTTDPRTNVANGAMVVDVSSNWNGGANDSNFGADNAIDGSMATDWASDGEGDDAWIEIGLAQPKTVSAIGIRSRQMADGTAIVLSAEVFIDDVSVGVVDTPDPAKLVIFEIAPTALSTLRIEVLTSTGGNTGLRELQLLEAP